MLYFVVGHVGGCTNAAIATAASVAIKETVHMEQGRRTASMKASYDAVSRQQQQQQQAAQQAGAFEYAHLPGSSAATAAAAVEPPPPPSKSRKK